MLSRIVRAGVGPGSRPAGAVDAKLGFTSIRRAAFGRLAHLTHKRPAPKASDRRQRLACDATGASAAAPDPSSPSQQQQQFQKPPDPQTVPVEDVRLSPYHYVAFFVMLGGGLLFVAALLYFTGEGIEFQRAMSKVFKRLLKTFALRQVATILSAMAFVKYGLEPVIKMVRAVTKAQGPWEKSSEYYLLREVYKPLEFLFLVAAFTTLGENFLPQVINIPKGVVQTVVRSTLSLTFVFAAARVVFNIKARVVRESAWQLELKGDLTRQRRLEALDKLMSVVTLVVASVFGVNALGMDVNSVLAIGGVGGVAVGLAGREILENLFTGLIILSSNPFEVGDEVSFRPSSGQVVEGIVVDVGWYRTTIRSFEREIYTIPNSVFSRNVVLNITRKNREWRFYEMLGLRLEDVPKAAAVVSDVRKILRQDARIIQKLHRRVFLDKLTREECTILVSFYVEAANRDAFMAVKQDLLLAFIDCVERNGARLARSRLQLEVLPTLGMATAGPVVDLPALAQPPEEVAAVAPAAAGPSPGGSGGSGGSGGGGGSPQKAGMKDDASSNIVAATATSSAPPSAKAASGSASAGASAAAPAAASSSSASSSSSSKGSPPVTNAGGAGSASSLAAQQAMASLVQNPGALSALVAAVAPDAILGGSQEGGNIVMGSFDERL